MMSSTRKPLAESVKIADKLAAEHGSLLPRSTVWLKQSYGAIATANERSPGAFNRFKRRSR
jgi:hypothetical protein